MDFFSAIILGVIEGVTEFLPISSTGHLILAAQFLRVPESEFLKSFEIVIQLGAILAVVALYGRRVLVSRVVLARVAVGALPTLVIAGAFYPLIKKYLLGNSLVVVAALFLGGVLIILFERWHRERAEPQDMSVITYRHAALIGLAQAVSVVPGVSRAAATIIGGLLCGYNRKTVVEFSFLLAVPVMAAATAYDLYKSYAVFGEGNFSLLAVGFTVSFVTALLAVRWLMRFIQHHNFTAFGVYRIAAALLVLLFIL